MVLTTSRRGLVIELAAAALLLRYGAKRVGKWFTDRQYDGLEGIVSFSSRIIAAWRAIETEDGGALFQDPLAETLAGTRAMQRARQRIKEQGSVLPAKVQTATGRTYQVGRVAIRTLWFDSQLLAALDPARQPQPLLAELRPGDSSVGSNGGSTVQLRLTANATPRQVVMLGAGMDTRAWRLQLPPGVAWFEVDRADVLAAKRVAMTTVGASFEPCTGTRHPLKAASYASLAADLREAGWTRGLQAQGFDPSVPTVWLAECLHSLVHEHDRGDTVPMLKGLLMYLEREANHGMLREVAGASAPGSVLLALSVTEAVIRNIRAKQSKGALITHFVWGCPPDPRQEFRGLGWDVQTLDTRAKMVKDFGIDRRVVGDYSTPSDDYKSLFIVATPSHN